MTTSKTRKLISGGCFLAFLLIYIFLDDLYFDFRLSIIQTTEIILVFAGIFLMLPKKNKCKSIKLQIPADNRITKRTTATLLIVAVFVPLTVFCGMYYLDDRKYYFISILIILETLIPFLITFEKRKPKIRELIIISVLSGIAVSGRVAFFFLSQFKPMIAVVILSGIALGSEAGFLVGIVSAFISNFFFGQGPWTPWQMLCSGLLGLLAGILFKKGVFKKSKTALCCFGFLSVIFIYGAILNCSSVFMYQENPNLNMLITSMIMGIPFDLVHGASTVFFLYFFADAFIEKLERIKLKYGI